MKRLASLSTGKCRFYWILKNVASSAAVWARLLSHKILLCRHHQLKQSRTNIWKFTFLIDQEREEKEYFQQDQWWKRIQFRKFCENDVSTLRSSESKSFESIFRLSSQVFVVDSCSVAFSIIQKMKWWPLFKKLLITSVHLFLRKGVVS